LTIPAHMYISVLHCSNPPVRAEYTAGPMECV
jgi:hypothetical protein